jgi:ribosome-associated protein
MEVGKTLKDGKEKALFCARIAKEKKAQRLLLLELKGLSNITDYFLICSGNSDRHVQTIAREIEEKMEEMGEKPLGVEGLSEGRWVLLDFDEVVVHVFQDPVREYYDLEGLWIEAPRIPLPFEEEEEEKRDEDLT